MFMMQKGDLSYDEDIQESHRWVWVLAEGKEKKGTRGGPKKLFEVF